MSPRIIHCLLAFCLFKVAMAGAWTGKLGLTPGAIVLWFVTGVLCGAILMVVLAVQWKGEKRS